MTVYLLLIDPTAADLALAGRIAATTSVGQQVHVTPIEHTEHGPLINGHAAEVGLRIEIDRTVRRRPRPKRRIPSRVADLHTQAGTVPR